MLSRAALPLLRPRPIHSVSRLAFSQYQIRGIKNDRSRLHVPEGFTRPSNRDDGDKYKQPLRSVPRSEGEDIQAPQSAHDPSDYQHAASSKSSNQAPRPVSNNASEQPDIPPPSEPLPDLTQGIPSEYNPNARPQKPLPDLTQGIPSTIDEELSQAANRGRTSRDSSNITEEPQDPQSPNKADRGGDGLPKSSYVSSSDQRRNALTKYFYLSLGLGTVLYGLYMGRNWDEEEAEAHKDIPAGYTPGLIYKRAMARWGSTVSYYTDPVTKKLLPERELVDPNLPPYTLVIGLEDVLVRSEWSREHGWRIAKRPGLDYFLKYLNPYYELVIFSSQPSFTVDQILRKIDPFQFCYPLFREMTVYEDGGYVKDLAYLNRDLNKVVVIDSDPHHVKKQPDNAIVLPKWDGNPQDTTLIDLIPFLENLASLGYSDTREVLKSFDGKSIPQEFDRRQKLMRDKFHAEQAEKKKKRGGGLGLGSLFGSKPKTPDGLQSIHDAEAEGKMYSDIIRERGQQMYLRLHEHLEKEGPKMLAEREALEKKMQDEAMASMKSGMFGWFGPSPKKD